MAEVSELPLNKDVKSNEFSNIVKNISETINNCQTLDEFNEFKSNWNKQNKIISLWGIFASYFEDQEEWEKLKKELQSFVIDVRNKVMHHRPIRFDILKKLEELQKKLITIFDSAKPQLSEVDKQEVKQKTERILNSSHLDNLIKQTSSRLTSNLMEDLVKQASIPPMRSNLDNLIKQTSSRLTSNLMEDLVKQASIPPMRSNLDNLIKQTSSRLTSNLMEDLVKQASIPPARSNLDNLMKQTSSRLTSNLMEDLVKQASIPPARSNLDNLMKQTSSRLTSNLMEDLVKQASIPPMRSNLDNLIEQTSSRLTSNLMEDLIPKTSIPPARSNFNDLIEQTSSRLTSNPMEDLIKQAYISPIPSNLDNLIKQISKPSIYPNYSQDNFTKIFSSFQNHTTSDGEEKNIEEFYEDEDEIDSVLLEQSIEENDDSFVSFDSVIEGYNKLHGTNFDEENLVNG
jgi:hypothetical protein